jgi:microsomal dipeptidase-like Zn-dependent dipeptidase
VIGIGYVGIDGDFIRQVARALNLTELPGGLMPPGMPADAAVEGLEGPGDYPSLVAALERRDYVGERLESVLCGNLLHLFREALPAA